MKQTISTVTRGPFITPERFPQASLQSFLLPPCSQVTTNLLPVTVHQFHLPEFYLNGAIQCGIFASFFFFFTQLNFIHVVACIDSSSIVFAEWLGHTVVLSLTFKETTKVFLQSDSPIYIPTSSAWRVPGSRILLDTWYGQSFPLKLFLQMCSVLPYINSFNLYFPDA